MFPMFCDNRDSAASQELHSTASQFSFYHVLLTNNSISVLQLNPLFLIITDYSPSFSNCLLYNWSLLLCQSPIFQSKQFPIFPCRSHSLDHWSFLLLSYGLPPTEPKMETVFQCPKMDTNTPAEVLLSTMKRFLHGVHWLCSCLYILLRCLSFLQ